MAERACRVAAMAISAASTSLHAQGDIATGGGQAALAEATFAARTVQGQLDACEVTYLLALEDFIYKQGQAVFLRGALSLNGATNDKSKPPYFIFKITAFDIVNNRPQFSPLFYAYLSKKRQSYAGKEFVKFQCDDGGLCIGYEILKNADLTAILNDPFEINFNRTNGGSILKCQFLSCVINQRL